MSAQQRISVLNYGSINIDHIYRVPHFVQPGETLASRSLTTVLGGKGANQSVALARAGIGVAHIGRIGRADHWALDSIAEAGVIADQIELIDGASGHAIIQVDDAGENSIVLHGGANQSYTTDVLQKILSAQHGAEYLLMQNECNLLAETVTLARQCGLKVALNPAPMNDTIKALSLQDIDILIVNQVEAEALTATSDRQSTIEALSQMAAETQIVLTLGADGAVLLHQGQRFDAQSPVVSAVDTTGAGDTFVGYYLAGCVTAMPSGAALERACRAAAIAVTREGATPSIPALAELE